MCFYVSLWLLFWTKLIFNTKKSFRIYSPGLLFLQKKYMRIDILTVVPELLESPFKHSIIKRGIEKGLVEIYIHNIRDFSEDKHKKNR